MVRSSRHGMGISPQKEVRRSVRERTTVYRSLAENQLGNNFEGIYREHTGYTRSGRKCDNRYNEDSSDSERNYETRRTRRRSLRDEEEHIAFSRPKRRKIIISDMSEHDEVVEESHSMQNGNAYERVKPRRNINGSQSPEKLRNEDNSPSKELRVSLREQRIKNRVIIKTEKADEENEDNKNDLLDDEKQSQQEEEEESITSSSSSEEDEEEVQGGQRAHYELRRRNTSPTKQAQQSKRHTLRNRSRPSYKEHDPIKESKRNDLQKAKHQRQNYKRRMCRSDSSSTGSDHESNMRRHEDEHFERRKEASMKKARNRFVPMNLTDNELASAQSVIRERMRQQTGASCSDVDPMEVDTTIGFEDIGGLGSHIKSLKEIVLFPMVYPDVFQNFNIKAPRGVLFYGPPGTGKTLVARALANECSRGNKKVAFFMRKGADCLSKWVGESERQLRILFDQAYAMRPSIIFFDEIDGLAPVRSTRQDQIHSSIVSTLLALMDGLDSRGEVIVIGATNRLDSIDPALRRPGRFDKELKFSLPDSAARQQILKIHTAKWGESQPSAEEIDWIAGNTSGYCGADLKYLCTESVMISLRNQFPHIYLSNDRLKLDLSNFKVSKEHIITAMKKITPASRRDFSIPCRPLDDRTSILLQSGLNNILLNLPAGYRCSRNVEATGSCELEKVVRGLEEPPAISATRLFLTGSRRCPDMGQTSYILPALLSKLDHLPVHCISISKLFTDGRPEEAFATIFQSALRTAAIGPCILLCPSIDEWFKIVPLSVSHMLKISLSQITGFTPILFIASCEGDYDECPEEVTKIFRAQHCLTMAPIPQDIRTQYFKFVCSPALLPPTIFDPSKYPEPEKAVIEDVPVRKLNKEEAEVLENVYEKQLREFRIFIRDQLAKVFRDRRFTPFTEPVTKDVASDYYEIIKKPMCLTQIQQKIDMREYVHPDQFLGDIQLIVDNALEYNPPRDPQGQSIRHNAMSMRDIVEDIFEKEFDEDFVGKLEESARLLIEANIVPKNEKLINLPKGFIRKSKWRVADGFKGNSFTNFTPKGATPASSANRSVKFRGATYNFSNGKKKQKSKDIVQSIARQLNQTPKAKEEEQETPEQVTPTTPLTSRHPSETEITETRSIPKIEEKTLLIDKEKIDRVVSAAVRKTDWWPVPEMEALAASLSNCIENCRDQWDRRALSTDLLRIVEECDYEPSTRQHLQNSTDFSASSP